MPKRSLSVPFDEIPLNAKNIRQIEFENQASDCDGCPDGHDPKVRRPVGSEVCIDGQIFECRADGRWWNTHKNCP